MRSSSTAADAIYAELGLPDSPVILDVRDDTEFARNPRLTPGALRMRGDDVDRWARRLPRTRPIVAYCENGRGRSASAVSKLIAMGYPASVLQGGFAEWMERGYPSIKARADLNAPGGSKWVTRERPKIDRLACPWLVRRFIDPWATFFYTPAHQVRNESQTLSAEPYDIADVTFSHRGTRCSFDAFLDEFDLHDGVLDQVADIVRAADTGELTQSREAPGLLAISLGLSANNADDLVLLEQAMPIYDALYAWRKKASAETHSWPQKSALSDASHNQYNAAP
jgi:rhodanese-related sulfurtransferase